GVVVGHEGTPEASTTTGYIASPTWSVAVPGATAWTSTVAVDAPEGTFTMDTATVAAAPSMDTGRLTPAQRSWASSTVTVPVAPGFRKNTAGRKLTVGAGSPRHWGLSSATSPGTSVGVTSAGALSAVGMSV